MAQHDPLVRSLLGLIDDGLWRSPWHTLAEATSDLTDATLDFRPVAGVAGHWASDMERPARFGARAILRHLVEGTLEATDVLTPEGCRPARDEWGACQPVDWEGDAQSLVAMTDAAFRIARQRTSLLRDEQLFEPARAADGPDGWSVAEAVVQCFILHPHWHLGQLALIPQWMTNGAGAPPTPGARAQEESVPPMGDWPYHLEPVGSRKDLLLAILGQAEAGCPWHAFERVLEGLGEEEARWTPCPGLETPYPTAVWAFPYHVAGCDVMYSDMAFGERRGDWDFAHGVVGMHGEPWTPAECLEGLRRGFAFLTERVTEAGEDRLDDSYLMHHGHTMTGFEVVACMIQHTLWHAGQVCLMRDAYTAT